MVWIAVGFATAQEDWTKVGTCVSELIRVSYTFPTAPPHRPILGYLRQRWDARTYDARWYRLYPKLGERETYELRIPSEFVKAESYSRELQIRKASNGSWNIAIEQWL